MHPRTTPSSPASKANVRVAAASRFTTGGSWWKSPARPSVYMVRVPEAQIILLKSGVAPMLCRTQSRLLAGLLA